MRQSLGNRDTNRAWLQAYQVTDLVQALHEILTIFTGEGIDDLAEVFLKVCRAEAIEELAQGGVKLHLPGGFLIQIDEPVQ